MKVGDFVVERLHAWGVRRIYGYPGDGINGVIGALQRANKIEFVQVRHEEMAFHGRGPRQIHRRNWSLSIDRRAWCHAPHHRPYDAKLDHTPVLA